MWSAKPWRDDFQIVPFPGYTEAVICQILAMGSRATVQPKERFGNRPTMASRSIIN